MKRLIKVTLEFEEIEYIPEQCTKCGLNYIKVCGRSAIKLKDKGD